MNLALEKFLLFSFVCFVAYLFGSFVSADLNIGNWPLPFRGFMAFMGVASASITAYS